MNKGYAYFLNHVKTNGTATVMSKRTGATRVVKLVHRSIIHPNEDIFITVKGEGEGNIAKRDSLRRKHIEWC